MGTRLWHQSDVEHTRGLIDTLNLGQTWPLFLTFVLIANIFIYRKRDEKSRKHYIDWGWPIFHLFMAFCVIIATFILADRSLADMFQFNWPTWNLPGKTDIQTMSLTRDLIAASLAILVIVMFWRSRRLVQVRFKQNSLLLPFVILAAFLFLLNIKWASYIILASVFLTVFHSNFIKKYDDFERGVIFRMGRFHRVAGPGWSFVLPFFEKEYIRIDVREKIIELNIDVAFTRDELTLKIKGAVYYQIDDARKAVLCTVDHVQGLKELITSNARNIVARTSMVEILSNLPLFNDTLIEAASATAESWGLSIRMVQLREVIPPREVAAAMHQVRIAQKNLEAEHFRAKAKKLVMAAIGEGAKNLDDRAMIFLYLEALKSMGQGATVLFPASFMDVFSGVGDRMAGKGIDIGKMTEKVKSRLEKV